MTAAKGVRRVWVGQNGLPSTLAVSAVIRERIGAEVSSSFCYNWDHLAASLLIYVIF